MFHIHNNKGLSILWDFDVLQHGHIFFSLWIFETQKTKRHGDPSLPQIPHVMQFSFHLQDR